MLVFSNFYALQTLKTVLTSPVQGSYQHLSLSIAAEPPPCVINEGYSGYTAHAVHHLVSLTKAAVAKQPMQCTTQASCHMNIGPHENVKHVAQLNCTDQSLTQMSIQGCCGDVKAVTGMVCTPCCHLWLLPFIDPHSFKQFFKLCMLAVALPLQRRASVNLALKAGPLNKLEADLELAHLLHASSGHGGPYSIQ